MMPVRGTLRIIAAAALILAVWAATAPAEERPLVIVMSGDSPPYHSVNAKGELSGLDIDMAHAVGREIGRRVTVRIVSSEEVARMIEDGEADMAVGVTVKPALQKKYLLSRPYLNQRARLFIHERTSVVRELADLSHLRVGVRDGIDITDYLKIVRPALILSEPSAHSGLKNLMNRTVDIFVGDEYECQAVIQRQQLKEITTVGDPVLLRRRVFAVHRGQAGLVDQVNQALDDLQRDYRLQEIHDRWLAQRVSWVDGNRTVLILFLLIIALMTLFLLGSVLWNRRLSEAIADRTREVEIEHAHFQNIFDHASDGIVVIDPDSMRAVEANRTFLDLLQYAPDDLRHVRLSDLDASPDRGFAEHIQRAFTSGENVLFEVRLINQSREPVDLFIHAKAFPYRGKRMVEAIARDITHRKKLESMKDTVLQDVAHELKTPMSKLILSLELLEQKLSPEARERAAQQLEICRRSVGRLQHTVEGILHLSRLEANVLDVEMGVIDPSEVAEGVLSELRDLADRKGIELRLQRPAAPLRVRGDREMIRRLFVNLVQNAIKFTDSGAVTVSLSADSEFVKICVADTGIGLASDDLSRIFNRFFQKSAAIEGSGIGLTISQKIVAFHNGVIWAESQGLGKGTQMYVLLPQ